MTEKVITSKNTGLNENRLFQDKKNVVSTPLINLVKTSFTYTANKTWNHEKSRQSNRTNGFDLCF
jgi:hypothetical protein